MSRSFRINLTNFQGLAPGYFESNYPSFGNKEMAGKAQGIDLTDPSYLKQGVGTSTVASGLNDDMRILDEPVSKNKTYGVAGDTVYEVTNTSVSAIHTLPTNASGEDVAYYQDELYVSYNTDASGVVAKWDISADSWNDTWENSLNKDMPHRMEVGGLDFLYIADGPLVASWDGKTSTWANKDLDLPDEHIIKSMQFTKEYLQILTNKPSTNEGARSSIFLWNTTASSWNVEYTFRERITNNFVLNGVTYLHYDDNGRSRLGLLDGAEIKPAQAFSGESPEWYQVTTYKGFIAWVANGEIMLWGAPEAFMEPNMFPIITDSNASALASPFGGLLVAGGGAVKKTTSSYETGGYWKSLLFSLSGDDKSGVVDSLRVGFNQLPSGKSFTVKLVDEKGAERMSQTVSTAGNTSLHKILGIDSYYIRAEFHFDNDSTSTVEIRDCVLMGHTRQ